MGAPRPAPARRGLVARVGRAAIAVLMAGGVGVAGVGQAATIHVPAEAPTLQAGIDAAVPGDIVLVAPGSYSGPGNEDVDFAGKDIVLRSESGPDVTIVQGPNADPFVDPPVRGFIFHSGETEAAVVEGFTVRDFAILDAPIGNGGAAMIVTNGATPTVRDCRFLDNRSIDGGGGAVRADGGLFEDCEFRGNVSEGWNGMGSGGGIYLVDGTLRRCTIRGNQALESQFGAGTGGGAVLLGAVSIEDCLIVENTATIDGGLLVGVEGTGSPEPIWITGCTIADNEANMGAAQLGYSASTNVSGQRLYISTSILWSDGDCGPSDIATFEEFPGVARLAFICSVVDPSSVSGPVEVVYDPHSIEDDPLFCAPRNCGEGGLGDYALQPESPCLPGSSSCGALIGAVDAVCGAAEVGLPVVTASGLLVGAPRPNPARNEVRFSIALEGHAEIDVSVFDATGRQVTELPPRVLESGVHDLTWDLNDALGRRVPAGVYHLRVRSPRGDATIRFAALD